MDYLRQDITEDEFKRGLVIAAIGLTGCLPEAALLLVPHFLDFNRIYLFIFLGFSLLTISYVAVKVTSVWRTGKITLPPKTTFMLITSLMVSSSILNAGGGGHSGIWRLSCLIVLLFTAIIGDKKMVGWMLGIEVVCLTLSNLAAGIGIETLIPIVMIEMSVSVTMVFVIRFHILGLMAMGRSRVALQELTDAALSAATVEDGLRDCLPMVDAAFPSEHIVAYLRRPDEIQFSMVASWPDEDESDLARPYEPEFARALRTSKSVLEKGLCYIPIGFTVVGELVLIIRRRTSDESQTPFSAALAEAIAASFMRLAGQVANVNGLRGMAKIDPLTRLANRRALSERSETEIVHAARSHTPLSVAMLDIDHFKVYNDTYGHLAGDALLSDMSKTLAESIRSGDFIARIGGEEFCAILPETNLEQAQLLVDGLRERIHQVQGRCPVSISGGVATWNGYEDFEDLVLRADRALYAAKAAGRDKVLAYSAATGT